jgi:hypothetical protein
MYNCVRRNGAVNYIFPPSPPRPAWSRPPAVFITEFEYSVPYFQGQIGLLKLQSSGYSYVPWCPSYPDNLWDSDESSEEEWDELSDEHPSWHDELGEEDYEAGYYAEVHQHDP